MEIDLVILSRDLFPLRQDVAQGIESQRGVTLKIHRLAGVPEPGDPHRCATIVRARNRARNLGVARLVMLLDDDVVLDPDCIRSLQRGLERRPGFAALAADSAAEMVRSWQNWDYPGHVGMAAVLFRREVLELLSFRWEPPDTCECRCCCLDLRRSGQAIGYDREARAWHRPISPPVPAVAPSHSTVDDRISSSAATEPAILAAFDRRDRRRFQSQFLPSLRDAGYCGRTIAFAYGLYPSETASLRRLPGLEVVTIPSDGQCPAIRRLRDFQGVLSTLPPDTPVAYWDAGDVRFQASLDRLWQLVRQHPESLLVVREPQSYPENPVIPYWTDRILDRTARGKVFELVSSHPFFNSGFAAGTARALGKFLAEGDRLIRSDLLRGVGIWGDQLAMNVYLHSNPSAWREIADDWNYTLAGRETCEYSLDCDGMIRRAGGGPVAVVHGNALTLKMLDLSPSLYVAVRSTLWEPHMPRKRRTRQAGGDGSPPVTP